MSKANPIAAMTQISHWTEVRRGRLAGSGMRVLRGWDGGDGSARF